MLGERVEGELQRAVGVRPIFGALIVCGSPISVMSSAASSVPERIPNSSSRSFVGTTSSPWARILRRTWSSLPIQASPVATVTERASASTILGPSAFGSPSAWVMFRRRRKRTMRERSRKNALASTSALMWWTLLAVERRLTDEPGVGLPLVRVDEEHRAGLRQPVVRRLGGLGDLGRDVRPGSLKPAGPSRM